MLGSLKFQVDRQVVDLLDRDRSPVLVQHPARHRGREVLVQEDVLVPEDDVVGGERRAVRPLGPLAELDDPGPEVGRRGHALGQLHLDGRPVGSEPGEHVVDDPVDAVEVRGPQEAAPPDAAVLADLFSGDHQGVLGQALGDRRQLAGLHQVGQDRRLLVRDGRSRREDHAREHGQQQEHGLFHDVSLRHMRGFSLQSDFFCPGVTVA